MATRENQTCSFKLKLIIGTTESGKDKYKMTAFNHVNPAASDTDVYAVAASLAKLQEYTVSDVIRTDNASLIA